MENNSEKYTIEFVNYIECLSTTASTNSIAETGYNEKAYLEKLVKDAREYIKYNEWIVGLEILLDNLYEVDYKIDKKYLEIAKNALKATNNKELIEKYNWVDELKK